MRTLMRQWDGWFILCLSLAGVLSYLTTMWLTDSARMQTTRSNMPQSSRMIYLAHCDETGHYRLVVTDSEQVASEQARLGYWPVPSDYYHAISSSINTVTCVQGPMDSPHN